MRNLARPMRILNVCETAIGGVATYLNILGQVPAKKAEHFFLLPSGHVGAIHSSCSVSTYKATSRSVFGLFKMLRALIVGVKEKRPDIIFFHSTFALLGLLVVRLRFPSSRTIYCAHGWAVSRYRDAPVKAWCVRHIEGRLCGLADAVVNVSRADAALANALGYRGRHILIENAVEDHVANVRADLFAAEPDALHLLFVGRFDRQKGLDVLLAAFSQARRSRPDLRLHIAGAPVRGDSASEQLPAGARLAGWVEPGRIDDWYASADALVVPSRWEAFGLVVPEALRNGCPVLVSDRGALQDLIKEGQTGWTFALRVDALAELLMRLDKNHLSGMRMTCRESYEARFRADRLRDEIVALYLEHVA